MSSVREFIRSGSGRQVIGLLVVVVIGFAAYEIWAAIRPPPGIAETRDRWYVNIDTGKAFQHEISIGEAPPIVCPDTGSKTGYPAELCYWNPDGTSKDVPDKVVLNQALGKTGPTFCPVCHRLVVGHNPAPYPGRRTPPTEAEWKARHGG
jgi:hypothetical protein